MLVCPKCKQELKRIDRTYQCARHHSFDIAKRGYVNLVLGCHKGSGDDKDMIRARTNFLGQGYYQPLRDRLAALLEDLNPAVLVDAGSGEGYYTNHIKRALPLCRVYGFDLSKYAVDEACKAHENILYGVCSVFHMPLMDASADVLLSIFAPVDESENARILQEQGYFIKVGPGPKHLLELKQTLYDDAYENEESNQPYEFFKLYHEESLEYTIELSSQEDIWALFQMTPYYWKSPKAGSDRLRQLAYLKTQVQFQVQVYRKKKKEAELIHIVG